MLKLSGKSMLNFGVRWLDTAFDSQQARDRCGKAPSSRRTPKLLHLLESDVAHSIFPPILVVEVPPFCLADSKPLTFHRCAQQRSMPTLQRCTAGIDGVGARGR